MKAGSPYIIDQINLFETLYGKNMISLGGRHAIDNMFSDINLRDKKLLDIGFGLGGVAIYLAEKYSIAISGVEMEPWMAEYATRHSPKEIAHLLNFRSYNEFGEIPYPPASFDLAYSKGVFNHVRDKETLLTDINRVLKSKGILVIADWIYPNPIDEPTKQLVCETKESYLTVLNASGFNNIRLRDDSAIFSVYVKQLLERLMMNKKRIEQEYGESIYPVILEDHVKLLEQINTKQKVAVRIVANNSK